MKKYKIFMNFDKEEKWLTDMERKGYTLVKNSYGYTFQSGEPKQTEIKIDYRTFKDGEEFEDYRTLYEDSGWEHIAGTKRSGSQYFRRTDNFAREDIFSDTDSKAARYNRMSILWLRTLIPIIIIYPIMVWKDIMSLKALFNLKLLYLTPGLWERSGDDFTTAFLFETPFALMRAFLWAILPVMIVACIFYSTKAYWQYRKTLDSKV